MDRALDAAQYQTVRWLIPTRENDLDHDIRASRLSSHVINHSQAGGVTRGWGGGGDSVTDKRLRFGFIRAGVIMTVATVSTVH